MDRNRHYPRCHLMGEGEVYLGSSLKGEKFKVVDMSASGVRIQIDKDLERGTDVRMKIRFSGHVFEIAVNATGKIVRKTRLENSCEYALVFTDLSTKDRVEIDELIRYSCNLGDRPDMKSCEDGDCTFFKAKSVKKTI